MNGRFGILAGFLGLMLLNAPQGFAGDAPDVSGIYKKNCAMCHKPDGKGLAVMKTPDFTNKDWQSRHTDEQLIEAITKGSGEGKIKMPAFGEGTKANLSPETVKALVAKVRKFAE